jgi:hypothetical protein
MKHTNGPWHLIRGTKPEGYIAARGQNIATVDHCADPTQQANARLICAAPALLTSLERAVKLYGKEGGPWNVPGESGSWLTEASAAIKLAKGEEHTKNDLPFLSEEPTDSAPCIYCNYANIACRYAQKRRLRCPSCEAKYSINAVVKGEEQ